jgi:outer membrane receptor protein involved in Fe transport
VRKSLTIACLLGLLGGVARAQEEDLALEDQEMELFFAPAETVTSAARHTQPLEHSPSAVTVLTREDIEASGARTLPEALRLVPNMDIQFMRPLWYAVGIRGCSTANPDAMLLLVDGRDATIEFLGQPLWTVQYFSMDEVERIEIIRGPGSALYGANAFSGVVQVITRSAAAGPDAAASIRSGERGQMELSLRGKQALGTADLAVRAGMSREDRWTGRDISAREVMHAHLNGRADLGGHSRIDMEAGVLYGNGALYFDLGEITLQKGLGISARSTFTHDDLEATVIYDYLGSDMDFDMKLYYKELKLVLAELPPTHVATHKATARALHAVEVFHNRFTYGAEYVLNYYDVDALVTPESDEHRLGVFVQDEVQLSALLEELWDAKIPPLFLTWGLRFDWNSETEYELSPRASIVFSPGGGHSFRFGYAHAFLKPTYLESKLHIKLNDINDLGFDQLSLANPGLHNQTLDSLELGYHGSFLNDRLILQLDLAYNFYRSAILFLYDPSQITYKNVGGFRIPDINGPGLDYFNEPDGHDGHDVDFQLTVRPTERSRLFFIAGYRQVFQSRTGLFSRGDPVWHLAAGADLYGGAGWTASLRGYYVDPYEVKLNDPDSILEPNIQMRLPAHWFLNARVAYRISRNPLNVTAGVEAFNLLNMSFREHGGTGLVNGPDFGTDRMGRRIVLFLQGEI